MRLTPRQTEIIRQAAHAAFGPATQVWLFGSRVDDSKRGGDIDLFIETDEPDVAKIVRAEMAFLAAIKMQLGDQKIDVLVNYPARTTHPPIFEIARQTGVRL